MRQIQVLNRRAMARYSAFWQALTVVNECVIQARKTAEEVGDIPASKRGLAAPSGDEVRSAVKRAEKSLAVLSKSAQRWESELKSREWRY